MNKTVLATEAVDIGYAAPRRANRVIAQGLQLALRTGEVTCLLGPNGVGKSTLIRTLAGMQPPLRGYVELSGVDITSLPLRDLAQRLSVVLTERVHVGNLSAYALVALGRHPYTDWSGRLTEHDEAVVRWAIESVGSTPLVQRQVDELSDGERQRIMIARALAQEPLVMILDEPTAFLDLPRRVEMMRLLRQLARTTDRAVLLSTHDLDLALRSADVLWLMAPGGKIHVGAPEDLVLNGAFEAAFHSEGIEFDRHSGTFRINTHTNGSISLSGDGLAVVWTTRALERAGFQVTQHTNQSLLHITVSEVDSQTHWAISHPGQQRTCHSLYDVVIFLRQIIHSTNTKSTHEEIHHD
ncbi:MAG: ABC transporter ATP-binding protein [Blastochloris sp.]|nr:ABC transporter ATP-binding protein [Blastochloris sp.]